MAGRHIKAETPHSLLKRSAQGFATASVAGTLLGIGAPAAFAVPTDEGKAAAPERVAATVSLGNVKKDFTIPAVEVQTSDVAVDASGWGFSHIELEAKKETRPATPAPTTRAATPSFDFSQLPPASAVAGIAAYARQFAGAPYVSGGATPAGWDCSGFTQYIYAQFGINLPHQSEMQAAMGKRVPASQAQPGDLVHWPGHVGIYTGNGMHIAANTPWSGTNEAPLYGNPTFYRFG